jgi:hypothetical protein
MYRSYLLRLRFASLPVVLPVLLGLASCSPLVAPASESPDGGGPGPSGDASPSSAPGRYLTSTDTAGTGMCAGITLGDVLNNIRTAEPDLADIQTIYNPAHTSGDGSFIYPYARNDGGFDVVFKRGLGDCPAGCTDNDYLYFATGDGCYPARVGRFHAMWGAGTCLSIDGGPMWSHPPPPDPLTICGQDNSPAKLVGTYKLHAVGTRTPCTALTDPSAKAGALDESVTLTIQQDPADLGTGTVIFSGTGHPLVDGVALPARFMRRRFDADQSTTADSCARGNSVTARFDFEGYQPGGIEVTELGDETCSPCQGSMSLTLSP